MPHITAYNYDEFIGEKVERWFRFDEAPNAGTEAPDFPLTTLDGDTVTLKQIWRKSPYTIMEFGSMT